MEINVKREVEKAIGGLFFMIINTAIWTLIAEYYLENKDNKMLGLLIGAVILVFLFFYVRFTKFQKTILDTAVESKTPEEEKKDKRFLWIFGLEGLGIFLAKNILININHNELFIPFFALIVGLHFFPLGKLFQRKFDYYMGIWTSTVAIIGLYMIIEKVTTVNFANAIVSICCAISTICYGVKMIVSGQKAIQNK
ncbi:hypothetical protein [Flavobacterium sp. ENC]|uniref:DUF7010 family protein n=1 Tax=Flavobacterium sp. ENC TaxID=2897330 RepID=UPI001E285093|nr:hypothetical protein [Flavobacterium sp. ENC]MCD0466154.1 hypothetical protein [Flavobacterium sp. ENC]